jgi:hypothetical protein
MLNWLKGDKVDHPLANAKEAKKMIDEFPYKDPQKTLEDASYWLGSVNDTEGFKLERRFEIIDMLDMATRRSQSHLLNAYLKLREEDRVQEKRIWQTASDFWLHLGNSYLSCANQAQDIRAVPSAFRPRLAVVAARSMRASRQQMKWVLMRYGVERQAIWEETARCMKLAESADAVEKRLELYPGAVEQTSPADEFLRLMLFWAAAPSSLSPIEQDIAERLVLHLTPKFHFNATSREGCEFGFALEEERPPFRLLRSTPVTAATRYFAVSDARQAAQAMLATVTSSGSLPSGIEWGPAADTITVARVLKHVGINWAKELPARASERRRTALRLHVVHGYQNVQGAIEPGIGEGLDFSDTLAHDSWIAEDASSRGYGVIVPPGKGEWLRVGVLVALRSETDSSWNLGVIRRVKADERRQHHIGIQLISKTAEPVYLRSLTGVEHGSKRQIGILLSARPSPNGSLHIVVRRDLFNGREPLEALFGTPPLPVILEPGGVVESGHDFDWLRYKLSANSA